ncbi:MAG: hypothetical protein HY273_05175 [Gammaproteobacteria bacterium]|nr:hypothetical protein [Gammaproteobacteria bacterium]
MSKKLSVRVERVADAIAQYLIGNPHAADTVAGIQSWWLSGAAPGVNRIDVETAVIALVQRGVLECRRLPDGERVYSLKRIDN